MTAAPSAEFSALPSESSSSSAEFPAPARAVLSSTPRPRLADHGASLASWAKKRQWRARVYLNGKHISVGYYGSAEEARAPMRLSGTLARRI
jgi:hypothetical protein